VNVTELLQEETTYDIGKALNKELRDMAAELDLTWGEMPGFVKKGAWYGGFIGPKGGNREEKKREMTLPFDRRLKGFFKQLTKFLAQKHAEGHTVDVAANTSKNGKVGLTKPDQLQGIFDEVRTSNDRASCRWYISFSEAQASSSAFIRLDMRINPGQHRTLYADTAFAVGSQQKEVVKKLKAIEKNPVVMSHFCAELLKLWKEGGGQVVPNKGEGDPSYQYQKTLTFDGYVEACEKPVFKKRTSTTAFNTEKDNRYGTFYIKGGVKAKDTKTIDTAKALEAIDNFWRKV
jgi:hypothetical protein